MTHKRLKISTWELAGTFKGIFPLVYASNEKKADTDIEEEQDSFIQGLLSPSPNFF